MPSSLKSLNPCTSKEFRRSSCQALTKPTSNQGYLQMPLQLHQPIACSRSGVSCMASSMCVCLWCFAYCSNLAWFCQCVYGIAITAPMRLSLTLPLLPATEANPHLSHVRRKRANTPNLPIARGEALVCKGQEGMPRDSSIAIASDPLESHPTSLTNRFWKSNDRRCAGDIIESH